MEMYEIYLPSHVFKNGTRSKFVVGGNMHKCGQKQTFRSDCSDAKATGELLFEYNEFQDQPHVL